MNKIFGQIYYCFLFAIAFEWAYPLINTLPFHLPKYISFASPLNYISVPIWLHSTVCLSFFIFCLLCILTPAIKSLGYFEPYFRIITSILFILTFSIFFSYYQNILIAYNIWIISSIVMCFYSSNKTLNSTTNLFVLRLNQTLLLSHYFISCVSRLHPMRSSNFDFSFKDIPLEYVAIGFTYRNTDKPNFFLQTLLEQPEVLSFGFVCILIFQLSCLIPVFLNRFFILYGVLAILFHLSTGITLGIYFYPYAPAVLFFLIVAEVMKRKERSYIIK